MKNVGIMATIGTIKTGLFDKYLPEYNIIYPSIKSQKEKIMEAIYGAEGIKMGYLEGKPLDHLEQVARELIDKKVEIIVLACTEIPLVLKGNYLDTPIIDPMDVLAKRVVR